MIPVTPRLVGLIGIAMWSTGLHAGFVISGEFPAAFSGKPVTVHRESIEQRSATQIAEGTVVDGRFRLQVQGEPGLFKLRAGDAETSFIAADGQSLHAVTTNNGTALRVGGAPDQDLFLAYENFRVESLARLVLPMRSAVATARTNGNAAEVERLTAAEASAYQRHRRELNDFTLKNLRGSPALYAASLRWDGDDRLEELASAVREFAGRHPNAEITRMMQARIERFRALAIGAPAPPLAGRSPDGSIISLSDLRGRHVLIDFWAAWCPPCRMENRNYARLYRQFKADGFEILAVSVDQDERLWKAAIAQDGATWLHISELNGWQSALAARYNVSALPASFLLDPEGRIIAKDQRGQNLAGLLEQRLKRPSAAVPESNSLIR